MKAHWTTADYSRGCWKPLPFAEDDVDLIHRGLAARAAGRAAEESGTAVLAGGE